jgi:type VI protein secretion system component VasF
MSEDPRDALKRSIRMTEAALSHPVPEPAGRVVTTQLPRWVRLDVLVVTALVVAVLSLIGLSVVVVREQDQVAAGVKTAKVALCAVIDDSYNGAVRRQDVLKVADKLHRLNLQLPPGPAHAAVAAVEDVFKRSGEGSAPARKALNAELKQLGCRTRVT